MPKSPLLEILSNWTKHTLQSGSLKLLLTFIFVFWMWHYSSTAAVILVWAKQNTFSSLQQFFSVSLDCILLTSFLHTNYFSKHPCVTLENLSAVTFRSMNLRLNIFHHNCDVVRCKIKSWSNNSKNTFQSQYDDRQMFLLGCDLKLYLHVFIEKCANAWSPPSLNINIHQEKKGLWQC